MPCYNSSYSVSISSITWIGLGLVLPETPVGRACGGRVHARGDGLQLHLDVNVQTQENVNLVTQEYVDLFKW